jgi:hypothetical protein
MVLGPVTEAARTHWRRGCWGRQVEELLVRLVEHQLQIDRMDLTLLLFNIWYLDIWIYLERCGRLLKGFWTQREESRKIFKDAC